MNRLESKLFDLEELLIRNDGMADDGTYSTIVGIANDVSELESQNAKLRELVRDMWLHNYCSIAKTREEDEHHIESVIDRMRELGVEVDG